VALSACAANESCSASRSHGNARICFMLLAHKGRKELRHHPITVRAEIRQ
jgi:hypothetical protein